MDNSRSPPLLSSLIADLQVDGKIIQTVCPRGDGPKIVNASISDPFVIIRRADDSVTFFVGDTVARTVAEAPIVSEGVSHLPFKFAFGHSADDERLGISRLPGSRGLYRHHRRLPYFRAFQIRVLGAHLPPN